MPCLQFELSARRLRFIDQLAMPVVYKSMTLDTRSCIDLVVEDLLVVEVTAVDALLPSTRHRC